MKSTDSTELAEKPHKNFSELNETQQLVYNMTVSDVKTGKQAELLNVTPQHISRVKKDLSKYFIAYDTKLLKKSKRVASYILDQFDPEHVKKNKEFKPDERIKGSDCLSLIKMQQDRINPSIQHISTENKTIVAVIDEETLKKYQ